MANIRKHPIGLRFISYLDKWYTITAKTPDFYWSKPKMQGKPKHV